jgi:hypothetical protein
LQSYKTNLSGRAEDMVMTGWSINTTATEQVPLIVQQF